MKYNVNEFETSSNLVYVFPLSSPLLSVYGGKNSTSKFKQEERIMNDYEIFFVQDGDVYIEQDKIPSHVRKNEILLHFPYKIQKGIKEASSTFYWIHFTYKKEPICKTIDEIKQIVLQDKSYIQNHLIIPYHIKVENFQTLSILINLYIKSLTKSRDKLVENNYINLIISEISKQFVSTLIVEDKHLPARLKEIVQHIDLYYSSIKSIKEIASMFEYSDKYLASLFKKHLGVSPAQYLEEVRIYHADAILLDSSLLIKEIAFAVGFNDPRYFMRVYKKKRGFTPSSFRRRTIS